MSRKSVEFTAKAWNDYTFWQTTDQKTAKKITQLIKVSLKEPFNGIGKPEPLKHKLSGAWSRRIDSKHRLVYEVSDDVLYILSCRHHYSEK